MTRRANEDARARGQAPDGADPDARSGQLVDVRRRIDRWQGPPAIPPADGVGPASGRAAEVENSYTVRPFGHHELDSFTGAHGIIVRGRREDAGPAQLPWDMQRRTFRAAPSVPWDVGTAVGG